MNHYNRSNPFLYVLDGSNDELIRFSQESIKSILVYFILSIMLIVLSIVDGILHNHPLASNLIEILVIIGLTGFTLYQLKKSIDQNKTFTINQIKYPDSKITYTFINNEQLFQDTLNVNMHIGKLIFLNQMIRYLSLITILLCGYHGICLICSIV